MSRHAEDSSEYRIFVWEDLRFSRARVSDLLAAAHYQVIKRDPEVRDLSEALSRLSPPPDLLLIPLGRLDPSMLAQVRELRSGSLLRQVPLLGVTALDRSDLRIEELKTLGFAGIIDQGALPETLVFRVNRIVQEVDPRRRHERAPTFLPVDIEVGGSVRTEYLVSLSVGGMRFTSATPLEPNTDFTARFRVCAASEELIELHARVIHTQRRVDGLAPFEVGAFFQPLDAVAQRLIEQEVRRLLDECRSDEFQRNPIQESETPERDGGFRALLVDGSESDRTVVLQLLDEAYPSGRFSWVANGEEAIEQLAAPDLDLVICSTDTPLLDRSELLAASHAGTRLAVPVLFLLPKGHDADLEAALLGEGAREVVPKPIHREQFLSRIRLQLGVRKLCSELLAENAVLARDATTDSLTSLRNRRFLMENLELELSRARRYGTRLSLLLIDIDGFKGINDAFGHATGDAVLRRVGSVLAAKTRKSDLAARYGGDEFIWLLVHNEADGVFLCAERLREDVGQTPIPLANGAISVTISIGVAIFQPGIPTAEDLIARADEALYRAKELGRNRVEGPR